MQSSVQRIVENIVVQHVQQHVHHLVQNALVANIGALAANVRAGALDVEKKIAHHVGEEAGDARGRGVAREELEVDERLWRARHGEICEIFLSRARAARRGRNLFTVTANDSSHL